MIGYARHHRRAVRFRGRARRMPTDAASAASCRPINLPIHWAVESIVIWRVGTREIFADRGVAFKWGTRKTSFAILIVEDEPLIRMGSLRSSRALAF